MATRGPTIGASISDGGERAERVDVGAFYREHVAPKLKWEVPANVERLLHETLRDVMLATDPTATVFALASSVRFKALGQLGRQGNLRDVRSLLELSHDIGRIEGPDSGYLKQLSTSDLLKLARSAWTNRDELFEIQIREELGMRETDADTTLDNLQKLARLYYITGQDDQERLAKMAILRYLERISSQDEVVAAERVIGRMPMGAQSALRKLASGSSLLRAEIVLRRTALKVGMYPHTNFMNRYYLGVALKKAAKVDEALVVLESFLEHVESLRADGKTADDLKLKGSFDHWVFRARALIFECRQDLGTLDEAALDEAQDFFETNLQVYAFSAHEKLATIHEMRGEFDNALAHLKDLLEMREHSLDEDAGSRAASVRRMISELEAKMDAAKEAEQ